MFKNKLKRNIPVLIDWEENVGNKQGADDQVVDIEEHDAHNAWHKVADEDVICEEAGLEGDEHVQQQVGEEHFNIDRLSKD